MKIIDITHPHSEHLAPWPGDTPFHFELVARLRDGSSCNVGKLSCSLHTGTHLDAPYHYDENGPTVDKLNPEIFIGAARVFDASGQELIGREIFEGLDARKTPRILIRTNCCDDKSVFPRWIPTLAADIPGWLGEQGVRLVGLDLPSVDQVDSKSLPIHHALGAANIQILENLDLRNVPEGCYDLIALPLRLTGADGSLVRAILIEPGTVVD